MANYVYMYALREMRLRISYITEVFEFVNRIDGTEVRNKQSEFFGISYQPKCDLNNLKPLTYKTTHAI